LIDQGFSSQGTVTAPTAESTSFSSVGGTALTSTNWSNYSYGLCAYKTDSVTSQRNYVGNYIQTQCLGNCANLLHTGWAPSSTTDPGITSGGYFTNSVGSNGLGGVIRQVHSIFTTMSSPYEHINKVELSSATGFSVGDEVMFVIQSRGQSNSCGSYNNMVLGPTTSPTSARVIKVSSPYLWIQKGTWMDGLNSGLLQAVPGAGTNHCFVQAVRVPHFRDLTFANNGTLISNNFQFNSNPGGIIAFRVNGTLTMGDSSLVSVDGQGFTGGTPASPHGASSIGNIVISYPAGTLAAAKGNAGVSSAGGGAGVVGAGGSASGGSINGGSSLLNGGNPFPLLAFGGGGGAGKNVSDYSGLPGGGAIFIVSEKFVGNMTTPPKFIVDGSSFVTPSTSPSGAGGAGSINLLFKSSQGSLTLSAMGGDAGSGSNAAGVSPFIPGNGGGGYIQAILCDLGESGKTSYNDVGWNSAKGVNANTGDGAGDGTPKSSNSLLSKSGSGSQYCGGY